MAEILLPELQKLAQAQAFGGDIVEMGRYTQSQGAEAGLVGYKGRADQPIYMSDVFKPTALDEFGDPLQSTELIDGWGITVNLGRLIADENLEMRTDLAAVLHSHPMPSNPRDEQEAQKRMRANASDLVTFADQVASNPGLLFGIVGRHRSLGGTALRILRGGRGFASQSLEHLVPGMNIQEATLARLGLRSATLVYDNRTGRLLEGLDTLANLYQ